MSQKQNKLPEPFVPNQPRSMAATAALLSGRKTDARWRGVSKRVRRINVLDVREGASHPVRPLTVEVKA